MFGLWSTWSRVRVDDTEDKERRRRGWTTSLIVIPNEVEKEETPDGTSTLAVVRTEIGAEDLVFRYHETDEKTTTNDSTMTSTTRSVSCVLDITRRGYANDPTSTTSEFFDISGFRVVSNARNVEVYLGQGQGKGEGGGDLTYLTTVRGDPVMTKEKRVVGSQDADKEKTFSPSSSSSSSSTRSTPPTVPMFAVVCGARMFPPHVRHVRKIRFKMLSIKMPSRIRNVVFRGRSDGAKKGVAKKQLVLQSLQIACGWPRKKESTVSKPQSSIRPASSIGSVPLSSSTPRGDPPRDVSRVEVVPPSLRGLQAVVTGLARGLERKLTVAMERGFKRVECRLAAVESRVKALEDGSARNGPLVAE